MLTPGTMARGPASHPGTGLPSHDNPIPRAWSLRMAMWPSFSQHDIKKKKKSIMSIFWKNFFFSATRGWTRLAAPFLNPFFSLLSAQNVALMPSCDDHFASMRRDEANGRRGKAGGTQRTDLWPFQRDSQLRQPPATLLQTSYHFRAAAPNCSACCETSCLLFSFKSILTKLPFFN